LSRFGGSISGLANPNPPFREATEGHLMLDFEMPMTLLVFFTLSGMMAWTIVAATAIVQALRKGYGIYDRRQYVKDIAGMFRE
jgi:hypothetical protein